MHDHYEDLNKWSALGTAFECLDEIITNSDNDDDAVVARLSHTYSRFLRSRFMRSQNNEDLENAIAFAETSVERTRCILPREEHVKLLASRQSHHALGLFT